MPESTSYSFNSVKYIITVDNSKNDIDFNVIHPYKATTPQYLYKYYLFKNFSVDGITNNYLFSSHPLLLNDKYDCSGDLIDYSNLGIEQYLEFLVRDLQIFSEEKVKNFFTSEKMWVLERTASDLESIRLFGRFGIISLTENEKDALMWAYYSQNSGFVVKFDTLKLPDKLFGPFPINYVNELNKIDFGKYGPHLSLLYQTNVKHNLWERENEWRYISYNNRGDYHPLYRYSNIKSRYTFYNLDAVNEIILGYDFFQQKEIDIKERTKDYDVINFNLKRARGNRKLKKRLINFIINNNIPCRQIIRHRYAYLLESKEIKLEKLSPNKYKIYNIFKPV